MDDLVAILFWICIAVCIIQALAYILAAAICLGALGTVGFFLLRRFFWQLQAYRFTAQSVISLCLIGAISSCIATSTIMHAGYHLLLIIPVAAGLFLLSAVPAIGLWGYVKSMRHIKMRMALEAKRHAQQLLRANNSSTIKKLQNKNSELLSKQRSEVEKIQKFRKMVHELSSEDARTYSLITREMEARSRGMQTEALVASIAELEARQLSYASRAGQVNTRKKIELCMLKMEALNRASGNPVKILDQNNAQIAELEHRNAGIDQMLGSLAAEAASAERAYEQFRQTRIVLN